MPGGRKPLKPPALGTRFGLYEVISEPYRRQFGLAVDCRCHGCGKVRTRVAISDLLCKGYSGCWDCIMRKFPTPQVGERYGKLVVLDSFRKRNYLHFLCQCDCGNTREVYVTELRTKARCCLRCLRKWTNVPGLRLAGGNYRGTCPICKVERAIELSKFTGHVKPCQKCKHLADVVRQVRVKCPACGFYRKTRKKLGEPDPLCRACQKHAR